MGPLLFPLFINDLPLCVNSVYTDIYADDITLYDIQNSVEDIEDNLQIALDFLNTWCKCNGMLHNSPKTKIVLVTTNQKRQRLDKEILDLTFYEESLRVNSNDKILRVFVDKNLTRSDHIRHPSKKISSSVWLLSKVKTFLSQEHRIHFYKSYIQPHIDIWIIVWGSSSETHKQKIRRLQKRACSVILDYNVEDSSQAMDTLKIISIYDRLYLRKAKFICGISRSYSLTTFHV